MGKFRPCLRGTLGLLALTAWVSSSPSAATSEEAKGEVRTPGVYRFLAGSLDGMGVSDGTGGDARFADLDMESSRQLNRSSIAIDAQGNIFVSDLGNQTIRRVSAKGQVETVAGAARQRGAADGTAQEARFNNPAGLAFDARGTLYIADSANHTIRSFDREGQVRTVAGSAGQAGFADGPGQAARFRNPQGLVFDRAGNLLIADVANHVIRRLSPDGLVTTLAGQAGTRGDKDGFARSAEFDLPMALAIDESGNVFVSQSLNGLRRISAEGEVSTLALRTAQKTWGDPMGSRPSMDGVASLAVARDGTLLVADTGMHRLRTVSPSGDVTNLAGPFDRGMSWGAGDGPAAEARFYEPTAIAIEPTGSIVIFDTGNATLRRLSEGVVTTFAGRARNRRFTLEHADGPGPAARFTFQWVIPYANAALATDRDGNIYVTDPQSRTVRQVSTTGNVRTLAGSAGISGSVNGIGAQARFQSPVALAEWQGALYVCDGADSVIRKVSIHDAMVSTYAGSSGLSAHVDGPRAQSRFGSPTGIAIHPNGDMFIADSKLHTIRKIRPDGTVSTLAGKAGVSGEQDGLGGNARFDQPIKLTVDAQGNVFVIDGRRLNVIRRISPDGQVSTFSRNWHDLPRSLSQVFFWNLAADEEGNLLVVEANSQTVWKIDPQGHVVVLAGDPQWPGLPEGALPGRLDHPSGLAYHPVLHRMTLTSGNALFSVDLK